MNIFEKSLTESFSTPTIETKQIWYLPIRVYRENAANL